MTKFHGETPYDGNAGLPSEIAALSADSVDPWETTQGRYARLRDLSLGILTAAEDGQPIGDWTVISKSTASVRLTTPPDAYVVTRFEINYHDDEEQLVFKHEREEPAEDKTTRTRIVHESVVLPEAEFESVGEDEFTRGLQRPKNDIGFTEQIPWTAEKWRDGLTEISDDIGHPPTPPKSWFRRLLE